MSIRNAANQASRDPLETERNAYNTAFCELGLDWYWDAPTYARLRSAAVHECHVRRYLESDRPHLLRAYDAEFLVNAIESRKREASGALAS